MSNLWYIIPAREGSKGFPKKNQFLFDHTAKKIPPEQKKRLVNMDLWYIIGQKNCPWTILAFLML